MKIRNYIPESEGPLRVGNIEFKSPLPNAVPKATAISGDRVVVIYQPIDLNYENFSTANAFIFDRDGKLLFSVKAFGPAYKQLNHHYSDLAFDEQTDRLVLGTGSGGRVFLNLDNGTIESIDKKLW